MRLDGQRWDARYRGRGPARPSPPTGLAEFEAIEAIDVPGGGLCLDVACGLGEQSLWAAAHGFDVIALDVSATAIAALRSAAERDGIAERVDARVVDLDDGLPADVVGRCALVICQRFRDRRLYPALVAAARPGGLVVVTVLSEVGREGGAGAFHAAPGELNQAFGALDVEILRSVEADGEATLVARRRAP